MAPSENAKYAAEIIGYLAIVVGCLTQLPQVVRTLRTRNFSGLSMYVYMIYCFTNTCWIVYGVLLESVLLTISALPSLTYSIILMSAYCICGRRQERQRDASVSPLPLPRVATEQMHVIKVDQVLASPTKS
jgi:MtN3 and saliva related transmembrane protein